MTKPSIYQCFAEDDISGLLESVTEDFTFDHRGNEKPESPINKLWEGKRGGVTESATDVTAASVAVAAAKRANAPAES